jgi:hypothetical protein
MIPSKREKVEYSMPTVAQEIDNMSKSIAKTRRSTADIFGRAAPSKNLIMPEDLIVTVVEFVSYFPKSLRNYHVLLRFIQSGLDQKTIAKIVNSHRNWEKHPATANSICHFVEKEMREGLGGKKDWTVTKHMAGRITYDYEWDEEDLTLNGILLNCEVEPTGHVHGARAILPVESIPFADLARDVHIHPSYLGGDGFMLTRCVQYAAAHPEKKFLFPRDFAHLAQKLDDSRELTAEHLDAASITRWKKKKNWGCDENPDIETFEEDEDSDHEADRVDMGIQEDEHEEWVDVHDPLGFLNDLIASQDNTSSTSFHPHVTGSYRGFALLAQSVATGDMYAASNNNFDLFPDHTQGYEVFASSQYPDALHHNISEGLPPVHGDLHSGAISSRFDSQAQAFLHPPPGDQ